MNAIFTMGLLGDWVNTIFQSIMLWLDSVIYWFAAQCYQLFMKLSMAQIFDNNFYSNFANRIYSILGVFMLFYLAYALLNALVDPDKLAKGDKSVSKLASNLVISLVILGLLPSIFEYAYRLQNYILSSNVIGSLVFGTPTINLSDDDENSMIRYGDAISFTVLNTFLNSDNYNVRLSDDQKTWFDVKYEILHDGNYSSLPGLADPIVYGANVVGAGAGGEKTVDYKVGISTIAGVYLCYIMLSFTLDLGVRVAKLAFCQLIAPIPVIMRAMPGKKGTFDKWLKLTLSIFFEIFVRVAIMYISIYLINGLVESDMWSSFFSGGIQGLLALVIIILGILTFAKQAPKMISDVLGIDSGGLKLGIGEKLKAGGFFKGAAIAGVGGAMLGAGATGLVRNFLKSGNNVKNNWGNTHGLLNKGKLLAGAAGSTIAGATSGMFNAYTNPKNMKSLKDVKKQAGIGAQKSTENRINRESYRAAQGNTMKGTLFGHLKDTAYDVKEWATGEKMGVLNASNQHIYDVLSEYKNRIKNYEGLWKNEKQWIDADAANRYAKAELQAFNNQSAIFAKLNDDVKNLRKNNSNLSLDDAITQAMNSLYGSSNTEDKNALNQGISKYIDLARKSEEAANFLEATTQTIQADKGNAMDSMKSQIEAFRMAHKDMAEYIGEAGKQIAPNDKNIKKAYTQKLNELDQEKAMAEIKKADKK